MNAHELEGKRIAVVMMSAIGDIVQALPTVNSIRAAAPTAHISWVIQPEPHALLTEHPAIDEFLFFQRKKGISAYLDFRKRYGGKDFDLVITLQRYFKAGVLTGMLRAPRKLGFDRRRARDLSWLFSTERIRVAPDAHAVEQYLEFADHLAVPRLLEWGLGPTAEERERYAGALPEFEGPTVAMAVASSNPAKDWEPARYAELADRIAAELGARCLLVGGRSAREVAAAAVIAREARYPPLDLLEWDLRKLVYLLDRSDVLVAPDTAPLHIGVAIETPSVALMGYTNPLRVGPFGRYRELMVDAFGDPGEAYPINAKYREGRMARITVDRVLEKVRLALERYRRDRRHPSATGDSG